MIIKIPASKRSEVTSARLDRRYLVVGSKLHSHAIDAFNRARRRAEKESCRRFMFEQ